MSSQTYNQSGWVQTTTDPRGIVTALLYDDLGRMLERIEAFDGAISPAGTITSGGQPAGDRNRITLTTFDGEGKTMSLTALLPNPTVGQPLLSQTTAYIYGVTIPGSVIASNDLLGALAYPDPVTGAASTATANQERYSYLTTGQIATKTDGNQTIHSYRYDVLGRQLSDAAVPELGSIRRSVGWIRPMIRETGHIYSLATQTLRE